MSSAQLLAPEAITLRIATVRGQSVILDSDLAALYGVETSGSTKRSSAIWPSSPPTSCSHSPRTGRGQHCKYLPYAFTEHGAIMTAAQGDLANRLDKLEQKTEALAMSHGTVSRNTRLQLKQVLDALRELMTPPDAPKRPIGFVIDEDTGKKTTGHRA